MEVLKVLGISVAAAASAALLAELCLHWLLIPLELWRQSRLQASQVTPVAPGRLAH
jgi:hypothetical protein